MMPGDNDWRTFLFGVVAVTVSGLFLIVSSIGFFDEVRTLAKDSQMSLFQYVWFNVWGVLIGPASQFVGFVITFVTTLMTLLSAISSNRRERELRTAFAAGIWEGYAKNFLGKVLFAMREEGIFTPTFVIAFPSYDVTKDVGFDVTLSAHLPRKLREMGYSMSSLYGDGKAGWFRQVFSIKPTADTSDGVIGSIFFDYPSTFQSFHGAVDKIAEIRDRNVNLLARTSFFNKIREEFFVSAESWARKQGAVIIRIPLETGHVENFAISLIEKMKSKAENQG